MDSTTPHRAHHQGPAVTPSRPTTVRYRLSDLPIKKRATKGRKPAPQHTTIQARARSQKRLKTGRPTTHITKRSTKAVNRTTVIKRDVKPKASEGGTKRPQTENRHKDERDSRQPKRGAEEPDRSTKKTHRDHHTHRESGDERPSERDTHAPHHQRDARDGQREPRKPERDAKKTDREPSKNENNTKEHEHDTRNQSRDPKKPDDRDVTKTDREGKNKKAERDGKEVTRDAKKPESGAGDHETLRATHDRERSDTRKPERVTKRPKRPVVTHVKHVTKKSVTQKMKGVHVYKKTIPSVPKRTPPSRVIAPSVVIKRPVVVTKAPKFPIDHTLYEVERVVGALYSSAGHQYVLVKWTGYPGHEDTWELLSKIGKSAPRAVRQFYARYKKPSWKNNRIMSEEGIRHEARMNVANGVVGIPKTGGNYVRIR